MSRDLGRDVPDLENSMQENFGLIFRSLYLRRIILSKSFQQKCLQPAPLFSVIN